MFSKKANKVMASKYANRKRPFIDVMSEIGAGPIWLCTESDDVKMPIPPSELPISKELAEDLNKWQAEMDNIAAGPNPDFNNLPNLPKDFTARGRILTERLTKEIGDRYDIKYDQQAEQS